MVPSLEYSESGDVNYYTGDQFSYPEQAEGRANALQNLRDTIYIDQGDHISVVGLSLLKFGKIKDKLDEKELRDLFRGFSPRWTLPVQVRNSTNSSL